MVHPSELLRTDSNSVATEFAAPLDAVNKNPIDCGITALPCLNRLINLEKFTKPVYFVTVLSLIGFFQGVVIQYFRGTSRHWSHHYNISQETVDWLVYTDEVFIGFVALPVAYWGCRINRPSWIGGLAMFLSVGCLLLIVPEVYHQHIPGSINVTGSELCHMYSSKLTGIYEREVNYVAIVILCVFQIFYAMATVSYMSLGITYMDDNIPAVNSSGYVGLIIAVREIGKQIGTYLSWIPIFFDLHLVFVSAVWIILIFTVGILGCTVAMFPKYLPSIIINQAAASILSLATGHGVIEAKHTIVDGFFKTLLRILKNKVLIMTILSTIFIRSAVINLAIFGKINDQSRFLIKTKSDLSGYHEPPFAQITANLLQKPLEAIFAITVGIFVTKIRPRVNYLVIWNIVVFSLATLLFVSTSFFNCNQKIENELDHKIIQPFCSADCGCNADSKFDPVCLSGKTYFSPCFAGCNHQKFITTNQKIYKNCSCRDSADDDASDGSCDVERCNMLWSFLQVNNVMSTGFLSSTLVINMIINMRAVLPQDKGMALGLDITFLSIIPYLPVRAIYGIVAEKFCHYHGNSHCVFYSKYFGTFMSSATVLLMVLSIIFAVILLFMVKDLDLYKVQSQINDDLVMEPIQGIVDIDNKASGNNTNSSTPNEAPSTDETSSLLENRNVIVHHELNPDDNKTHKKDANNDDNRHSGYSGVSSTHPSLAEMENVGDDHDSSDESTSSSYKDAQNRANSPSLHENVTRKTSNEQLVTDF